MPPPAGSGPDMILKDLSQSLTIGHGIMIYPAVLHCIMKIMIRFASLLPSPSSYVPPLASLLPSPAGSRLGLEDGATATTGGSDGCDATSRRDQREEHGRR